MLFHMIVETNKTWNLYVFLCRKSGRLWIIHYSSLYHLTGGGEILQCVFNGGLYFHS